MIYTRMKHFYILVIVFACIACKENTSQLSTETKETEVVSKAQDNPLIYPEEVHFKNIQQVTFGGDNAEAYWSFDDKQLVFQSNYKDWGVECDQMFLMNVGETFKDSKPPMISTGLGR
ncbi:MAG: TolB protein, partial [Dokdonia sp.]